MAAQRVEIAVTAKACYGLAIVCDDRERLRTRRLIRRQRQTEISHDVLSQNVVAKWTRVLRGHRACRACAADTNLRIDFCFKLDRYYINIKLFISFFTFPTPHGVPSIAPPGVAEHELLVVEVRHEKAVQILDEVNLKKKHTFFINL